MKTHLWNVPWRPPSWISKWPPYDILLPITLKLMQIEMWFECLHPHFQGQGIQQNHQFELPVSAILDSKMAAVFCRGVARPRKQIATHDFSIAVNWVWCHRFICGTSSKSARGEIFGRHFLFFYSKVNRKRQKQFFADNFEDNAHIYLKMFLWWGYQGRRIQIWRHRPFLKIQNGGNPIWPPSQISQKWAWMG